MDRVFEGRIKGGLVPPGSSKNPWLIQIISHSLDYCKPFSIMTVPLSLAHERLTRRIETAKDSYVSLQLLRLAENSVPKLAEAFVFGHERGIVQCLLELMQPVEHIVVVRV